MNKLFFALITLSSLASFAALQASENPPCNHESLDEAWGDEGDKDKDDNHCGHHHHCD